MKMICIEGIDAVGKETVSKALEKTIAEKGYSVHRISFPIYEGDFGRCIKDVLMGACGEAPDLDHELMSPLYTLDRISYFKANIDRICKDYDYLICDRSFYSNFMYQASKIYMKEPALYNRNNDISPMLYTWIRKNFEWEFINTGLFRCNDVQTFVLTLSEEDSLKQLNNRTEKDTHEKNREYLNACKKFINHMTSDTIKNYSQSVMENLPLKDKHYMLYYINNVHTIEVIHAENPEDIDTATTKTVNMILKYLFNNQKSNTENNEIDMSNKFDVNDNVDLICTIAHSLKDFYNNITTSMGYKKDVIKSVQVSIGAIKHEPIIFSINFMPDCESRDRSLARYVMNHVLKKLLHFYKHEINNFIYCGFPYKLHVRYDGSNFDIEDFTEDK